MPDAPLLAILFQRILRVGLSQGQRQRIRGRGNQDKMNVVGHQTPSQHSCLVPERVELQHFEISKMVLIGEEDVLAVVAALGDVA